MCCSLGLPCSLWQASHHPWLKEPSPATALAAPSTGSTAMSASTATAATGLAAPSTPATATTGGHGGGVDGEAAVGSSPGVGGGSNGAALLATAAEARAQADAAARRRVERVIAHMGRVLVACRALGVVHSGQLTKQVCMMSTRGRCAMPPSTDLTSPLPLPLHSRVQSCATGSAESSHSPAIA